MTGGVRSRENGWNTSVDEVRNPLPKQRAASNLAAWKPNVNEKKATEREKGQTSRRGEHIGAVLQSALRIRRTGMVTDENKALVRRWTDDGYGQGNLALVDQMFAVDYVNRTPLAGQPPERDGVKGIVAMLRTAFADLQVMVEDIIAEGDKVVVRDQTRATHAGIFAGILPTGNDVTVQRIAIYRIADGRIVEHWASVDMLGLLQQLGAIPAPGRPES